MNKTLLTEIFNDDFSNIADAEDFHRRFFTKTLTIPELKKVSAAICASHVTLGEKAVPASILIQGNVIAAPYVIIAQLHGNEPAGLAGILLAMALSAAEKLENDIIGVIGNPLAATQYFAAWEKAPHARPETRDAYRCGLGDNGELLPDMNRIPVDFLSREPNNHHTKRAHELHSIGQHARGVLDIHSARGAMLCVTDHKYDGELKNSPIRSVLMELAEAISANASANVTVQTLKTIFGTLFDLEHQTGIEAGRHEAPDSPFNAATFTMSWLNTMGLTNIGPLYKEENGLFDAYHTKPRITYADLKYGDTLRAHDQLYMAKRCQSLASVPERSDSVIVKQGEDIFGIQSVADFTRKPAGSMEYAIYQYDEMEAIEAGQVVAVAVPSGTEFKTTSAFSTLFISKSSALYDKDPAVGPWPVQADMIDKVKFCYPCVVEKMKVTF